MSNPVYAAAYAYGKTEHITQYDQEQPRRRGRRKPKDQWWVLVPNTNEGYLSWEQFQEVQQMMTNNAHRGDHSGAGRRGLALLARLLRCRRCGRKLMVGYTGDGPFVLRTTWGEGSLAGFVESLNRFTEATGLAKAHLVGHSMGGASAILFAMAHPDRCQSLSLIASAGLGPEIDSGYIQGFISAKRRNELKPHLEKPFVDPRSVTRQLLEETLKYKGLDGVEPALRAIADHLCPGGRQEILLREELSRLPVPILVLWGADDRIVPAAHALRLSPNVRTEILSGCGHMLHVEAASKVNPIIQSFWGSVSKTAR